MAISVKKQNTVFLKPNRTFLLIFSIHRVQSATYISFIGKEKTDAQSRKIGSDIHVIGAD